MTSAGTPRVSIGMPVYNGGPFLREALESVLAQDFRDLEVVVCDDASADATASTCEEYARGDARVRVYRNPRNLGMAGNYEQVRALARGEYFAWMAQDDVCEPHFASRSVTFLDANPGVMGCVGSLRLIDAAGGPLREVTMAPIGPAVPWRLARRNFFRFAPWWELAFAMYGMYRRSAMIRVPFPRRRHRGRPVLHSFELPMLARLACQGPIVGLPDVLRRYRWHAESSFQREFATLTLLEERWLAARARGRLVGIAATSGLPASERLEAMAAAGRGLWWCAWHGWFLRLACLTLARGAIGAAKTVLPPPVVRFGRAMVRRARARIFPDALDGPGAER